MQIAALINRSHTAIHAKYLPLLTNHRCTSNHSPLPNHSEIIICGGGLVGNSTAYHLTKKGKNVLVLEKSQIGGASGSTGFDSGTIGLLKPIAMRRIIQESLNLYRHLNDTGHDIGFKQCGSISLGQTKDRRIALKRRMAYNLPTGLYCELISKEDIARLHPYLYTDDLECGVWVPEDATADCRLVCKALVASGKYSYRENCTVETVLVDKNRVVGVQTSAGQISCDYFINCAGIWARDLGLKSNPPVRIPAYPTEQFCAASSDVDLSHEVLPIIYDPDSYLYARQLAEKMVIGWFEPESKPITSQSYVPQEAKQELPKNIKPFWEKAIYRMPHLEHANTPTVQKFCQTYTPDGRWIVGEVPEIKNYFVGCGMNGNVLQSAGGIGKVLAEWLTEGRPTQDLLTFNIERFLDLHNNRQYLEQRVREVVGRNYAILYPHQCEYKYARKLRTSPLYSVLEQRGAVFETKMAYERALYFDTTFKRGHPKSTMPTASFYRPKFFDFMREEYLACRESVGIIDISSFSKIEIKSPGNEALEYLQRLCSNDVNIEIGSIVQTAMLNEQGGYENDCMIVRQTQNSFFMVSPSSQQTRVYSWMSKNLQPSDGTIYLDDVTSMYTVINVVGPKASLLMSELSNSDINFQPFTFKKINVAYASDVIVMSFTHTGEPGYCLYVPSEYALHVYDRLMLVGRDYGAKDVGTLTQRFMRIERFIPFWGEELTSFITPYEAGLGLYVNLKKSVDFIGKDAMIRQKSTGVRRRLCMFQVEDLDSIKDIWAWGGEPLYRNGKYVGAVTSVGYGFTTDKLVCLGFIKRVEDSPATSNEYITNDYILDGTAEYHVDVAGKLFRLTPYLHAPLQAQENKQKSVAGKYRPTVVSVKK